MSRVGHRHPGRVDADRTGTRPGNDGREAGHDTGAISSLVAVLLTTGVLLGMAALTVDVGLLQAERRQLQNGADAAALALAMSCGTGTCDTSPTSEDAALAAENANDGEASVVSVCGEGDPALPPCPPQEGPLLTRCPSSPPDSADPTGVSGWVRVRTATLTSEGGTLLPPVFSGALAGGSSGDGHSVATCAQAAWGASAHRMYATLPVAVSRCEWDTATSGGTRYAPPPPYTTYPADAEVALRLHSTTEGGTCPSFAGAYADLPGGFGWLEPDFLCVVSARVGQTLEADPGIASARCPTLLDDLVGTVVHLPVFSEAWGGGTGGRYRISGFAAFHLTGYRIPGAHPFQVASPVGGQLCRGAEHCLYGWFVRALVPAGGDLGEGLDDYGLRTVALR